MKSKSFSTGARRLCLGAMVAALYILLTYLSSLFSLSSGEIQFRLSEMLCILPVFMPAAVTGLPVGCLLANLLTGAPLLDVLTGSFATLLGAAGARLLRKHPRIAPLPTVLANALLIPLVLIYTLHLSSAYPLLVLTIGIGEVVCAWFGGILLWKVLKKTPAAHAD